MPDRQAETLAIIGLGYVGLPLAVAFGKCRPVLGFDISAQRIAELDRGLDKTREVDEAELAVARSLRFTSETAELKACSIFIVTVPTPVDAHKQPDFSAVRSACHTVAAALKPGDTVVFESTVYPGATEEICVPLLEQGSGLRFNEDFYVGYSPERINPGDRTHRLESIVKVVAGSTEATAEKLAGLYSEVVSAGIHRAPSIKVAEAAKVIENTQRDVNIALVNELAMIFGRMGIDTAEVLDAAGTKWNFLNFRPGLVGGHCIGVDPYYLTHKAKAVGHHPDMILAGREINDRMGEYVASQVARLMIGAKIPLQGARLLVMGLTFKEDCPDIRNTKVIDLVNALRGRGAQVDVHDPWVEVEAAKREYGLELIEQPQADKYDAVVLAVAHRSFRELGVEAIRGYGKNSHILYDLKSVFAADQVDGRL
ncbi:MAG TPA: Vi polysaccharide biosynthesis protein VipA/TviB [Porticoccaceae bacterium]|nr:Vi polysaccharide biosynthesis protein VipA/TviB [Porticoccaceae bacterium]HCO61662.1 Vi polysaccharide biosynthesis protein VipA/TviB [Porticoccaceae bacterium]